MKLIKFPIGILTILRSRPRIHRNWCVRRWQEKQSGFYCIKSTGPDGPEDKIWSWALEITTKQKFFPKSVPQGVGFCDAVEAQCCHPVTFITGEDIRDFIARIVRVCADRGHDLFTHGKFPL